MDWTLIETALRYALAFEFLLMAVVGLAVCVHSLSVDYKIRYFCKIQQDTLDGLYEGWRKAAEEKEAARQNRLSAALG
ncbi:MAG: hypothetical protein HQK87_04945 [Nitrospinae bacterium]|nr:hypothetical protein [Nitrospinota bacterium]